MPENATCPKCESSLPANAPFGLCPRCLLAASVDARENEAAESIEATAAGTHSIEPPNTESLNPLFPQLEILELVGHGGMGAVYKSRQIKLDRLVALKIIRPDSAADAEFAKRFSREARTMARLSHPNIVAIHDFGEVNLATENEDEQTIYYFVMEYVEGLNLRQVIATGDLSSTESLAIIPQICNALQYAHDAGVVHRDVKPENILLDQHGQVKIADFGLAKISLTTTDLNLTGTRQVMGTPRYMAPEQMKGTREVDHRADIYSLGVVFYEMLTGEVPAGNFDKPSERADVDTRLDQVVMRSLAQDPARRYQHASDVQTEIESISRNGRQSTIPAVQKPSSFSNEPSRSKFLRRKWWWLALAGLVVIGLLSVYDLRREIFGKPGNPAAGTTRQHTMTSYLISDAQSGNIGGVVSKLKSGQDPNNKDIGGKTALMEAAANGHSALCQTLMLFGASAEEKDPIGLTPLMRAAINGHAHVIAALYEMEHSVYDLESMMKLDIDPDVLFYLKNFSRKQKFDFEISIDGQNHEGMTALMFAAKNGNVPCVRALLDAGWAKPAIQDNNGRTALMHAITNKHSSLVGGSITDADQQLMGYKFEELYYHTFSSGGGINSTAKLAALESLRLRDKDGRTAYALASSQFQTRSQAQMLESYLKKIIQRSTSLIDQGKNLKELHLIRGAAYESSDQHELAQEDFEKAAELSDKVAD